jgi:CspA family cold shock protein
MHRPDRHSRTDRRHGFDDSFPSFDSRPQRSSAPSSRGPVTGFGPELEATVKWFSAEKGFGFVSMADGSGDVFLHGSVLSRAGHDSVNEGDQLRVRVGQGQKGLQVAEVTGVTPGEGPRRPAGPRPGPRSDQFGGARPRSPMGPRREVDLSSAVETRGTVKWFNGAKGFGFIAPENGGKDVFVHISALQRSGLTSLQENAAVIVQVVQGAKGPEAASVRPA